MSNSGAPPGHSEDLSEDEYRSAQFVVREFLRTRPGFQTEAADLLQEVLLTWIQVRRKYDSSRRAKRATFLRRVGANRLLDLERELKAEKRGGGLRPLSLDLPLPDADLTLGDMIPAKSRRDFLEVRLESVLPLLTQRQRVIVESLKAGKSKSNAAAEAGITRDTLYRDLEAIVRVFMDEDLEQFLH